MLMKARRFLIAGSLLLVMSGCGNTAHSPAGLGPVPSLPEPSLGLQTGLPTFAVPSVTTGPTDATSSALQPPQTASQGAPPRTATPLPSGSPSTNRTDGVRLAVAYPTKIAIRTSLRGTPRDVSIGRRSGIDRLVWSPDGSLLAFEWLQGWSVISTSSGKVSDLPTSVSTVVSGLHQLLAADRQQIGAVSATGSIQGGLGSLDDASELLMGQTPQGFLAVEAPVSGPEVLYLLTPRGHINLLKSIYDSGNFNDVSAAAAADGNVAVLAQRATSQCELKTDGLFLTGPGGTSADARPLDIAGVVHGVGWADHQLYVTLSPGCPANTNLYTVSGSGHLTLLRPDVGSAQIGQTGLITTLRCAASKSATGCALGEVHSFAVLDSSGKTLAAGQAITAAT